jgi:hypothetical protein
MCNDDLECSAVKLECDVLVAGSGAAGLAGAVTAAHQGARVIVVEKAPVFGGTSCFSAGLVWIPGSRQARAAGIEDDPALALQYLRGEVPGMPPVKRRMYPTKQIAVAEMRVMLEQTKALWFQAISEAGPDPSKESMLRALAAQNTVMENANAIATKAVRSCGGQAMLKTLPLERIYRDSRCGSLMLPWTAELCIDRIGRDSLYERGETDE